MPVDENGLNNILTTLENGGEPKVEVLSLNAVQNATDGVTIRWVQGIGGKNTSNGSTFFLTYNHLFKPASSEP